MSGQNLPKPVGPDFYLVQLSEAGCAAAGDHTLRWSNGNVEYIFKPGEPIKIARYEWDLALNGHTTQTGEPIFEIYAGPVQNGPNQNEAHSAEETH